jgi:hypothetical protein
MAPFRPEPKLNAKHAGWAFASYYGTSIIGERRHQRSPLRVSGTSEIPNQSYQARKLHTRCASCSESSVHDEPQRQKSGLTSTEFEHSAIAYAYSNTRADGLKEIGSGASAPDTDHAEQMREPDVPKANLKPSSDVSPF